MRIDIASFLLRAGSLMCLTATVFAWDIPALSCEPGSSKRDQCRMAIRHIEAGGVGYDHGYTTFEGFFSADPEEVSLVPFLDLRGHIFNNGYMAANAGLGFRKVQGQQIYGLNAYYDFRDTKTIHYNQVGFGFEVLGKVRDLRVNAYLPIGKKISFPDPAQFVAFSGNTMLHSIKYLSAMKGADVELGFHFKPSQGSALYAALGTYYHIGDMKGGAWGAKGRLKGMLAPNLALEVSNSYDTIFHNNFQLRLIYSFPSKGKTFKSQLIATNKDDKDISPLRMLESVERKEMIVLDNRKSTSLAIDPDTGNPFRIIFVDNTSHSDGTFESPYHTLASAQDASAIGDIIYVFPGDGTTTGMDAGIVLKESQKFWGSGVAQEIQTAQGSLVIPAHSASTPQLTNTGADGITLATNNQISGVSIQQVTLGNGIFGTNPLSLQISSSTIDQSEFDQIHLEYTGTTGALNFSNLLITHGSANAIFIDAEDSPIVAVVENSTITDHAVMFVNGTFRGPTDFTFVNNTIERNYTSVFDFSEPSTLEISGNTITNNTSVSSPPFEIVTGESAFSINIENNIITDSATGAVRFTMSETSDATLNIANNTITNNGTGTQASLGSAILISGNSMTAGNVQLVLSDNNISENAGSAVYNTDGVFNDFSVTATNNIFNNNGAAGFVFNNTINTLNFISTNNTFTSGGDHSITTSGAVEIDTVNMTVTNNVMTGNTGGGGGIAISHSGNTMNFSATDNVISDNEGTGIVFYPATGIENLAVTIENNTISNNQNSGANAAAGIDIEQFTNLSGTILNNILSNNAAPDVYIGSTLASPSACLTLDGNASDSGYTLVNDGGVFNLAPPDVSGANTGEIITIGTITIVESCPDAVPAP